MNGRTEPQTRREHYASMIDTEFLAEFDIAVVQAPSCDWQFFVSHPDLEHRFAYYPSTGSVVYEGETGPSSSYVVDGEEDLMNLVMSKVNK